MDSAAKAVQAHSELEFEAEIKNVDKKFVTAFIGAQIDVLEQILSPRFVCVTHEGIPMPREQYLGEIRQGRLSATSMDAISMQIQQVDENNAILIKHLVHRGHVFGKPFDGECWVTYVWSRSSGDWSMHAMQVADARLASAWKRASSQTNR